MSGLPVLTYHAIGPGRSPTSTPRARFVETVEALHSAGLHPVDLEDWVALGRPNQPRGYAVAFDDGLRSILDVADVLESYRIPATVFLVTSYVGRDNAWPGQPSYVDPEPILTWNDIETLSRTGCRFASHGRTHVPFDICPPTQLIDELRGSRDDIQQRLGRPCRLVAYPYGRVSRKVVETCQTLFAAGFGTRLDYASKHQDPFEFSRIDAYYLRSPGRLVSREWLRRRRVLREVKRRALSPFDARRFNNVKAWA